MKILKSIVLILLFLISPNLIALTNVDKQDIPITNYVTNGGFENGMVGFTTTGTASIITTDKHTGLRSLQLSIDNTTNLETVLFSIPYGVTTSFKLYYKTADTHFQLLVVDSTSSVVSTTNLGACADWCSTGDIYPTIDYTKTYKYRIIKSNAGLASIKLDDFVVAISTVQSFTATAIPYANGSGTLIGDATHLYYTAGTQTLTATHFAGALTGNADTATSAGSATTAGSATNFSGSLTGDVTGTQGATAVATVGTSSAANVHAAELLANAATNANTASAIVKRDASGNFTAGKIIAATSLQSTGGPLGLTEITPTPVPTPGVGTIYTLASDHNLYFQNGTGGVTNLGANAITQLTSDVTATGPGSAAATVVSVGGSSASNVHNAELAANAATNTPTNNTIAKWGASSDMDATTLKVGGSDINSETLNGPKTLTNVAYNAYAKDSDRVYTWFADNGNATVPSLSGNNTTFDGGGSIVNSRTIVAANFVAPHYFNYTAASNGQNDYWGRQAVILPYQTGRDIGFVVKYRTAGGAVDGTFKLAIKLLSTGTINTLNLPANTQGQPIAVTISVPYSVSGDTIKFGFQNTSSSVGVQLMWDCETITSNPYMLMSLSNNTEPTSYTPVFQGVGTPTNVNFYWQRNGSDAIIYGYFTAGTATGSELQIGLPSGLTSVSTLPTLTVVGSAGQSSNATFLWGVAIEASKTYLTMTLGNTGANSQTKITGSTFGTGATTSFVARVPISGWTSLSTNIITPASAKTQVMNVKQATSAVSDRTNEVEFNLATASIDNYYGGISTPYGNTSGQGFYAVDDSGNTRTKFVAILPGTMNVLASANLGTNANAITIYKNGSAYSGILAYDATGGGGQAPAAYNIPVVAGDYLTIYASAALTNSASDYLWASITFIPAYATMMAAVPLQQTCYIKDVKAQNTSGGTFTSGAWRTRDLNVINTNGSTTTDTTCAWASLSSNQFTLQPGIYRIKASVPSLAVDKVLAKLYNITSSSDTLLSDSSFSSSVTATLANNLINGQVSIGSATTYEIRHICQTTNATIGFGYASNLGTETYTQVEIIKVR
jgi:hypothetical protein